ncbi:MAG: helix-turn-helix transcriptional regulator [Desulfobacteraceae bacterium]|nr:helix-turn-helix transcriptional regulator [Desulfobacteraceae bacterium]
MAHIFGDFFKKMRLGTGLTLRKFCEVNGLDPGNISRLERGLALPPQSREKLESYAACLGIEKDSDNWYDFFDYASATSGKIPPDVMNDSELVKKLPLVFRTLRGDKVNPENLDTLAEIIRKT